MAWGSAVPSPSPPLATKSPFVPLAALPLTHCRLTAFVLKSFGQARAFVAIEERHITDAQHWLQKQQKESGCFRSVGKLFNNALQVRTGWDGVTWGHMAGGGTDKAVSLQGGVSDELSLSAYVTAALLELGMSPTVRITLWGWGQVLAHGTSPALRSGCTRPCCCNWAEILLWVMSTSLGCSWLLSVPFSTAGPNCELSPEMLGGVKH